MRILNENDEEITEEQADLTLGYLLPDQVLLQHHEATAEVQEQGHWETVEGEPDTQKWIVDVEYQPAKDAWDEYEPIMRYQLYSADELAANAQAEAEAMRESQQTTLLTMAASLMAVNMTDSQVADVPLLFANWTVGNGYKTGDVVRYQGGVWRALQDSTAQDIYPPDTYTAGWKRVGEPDEHGVYPWSQPLGATDAYPIGAVVSYDGANWTSTVDNNVWRPGVYGWTKQDDATDGGEAIAEWVQPTGAQDAYSKGAKVSHNGKIWQSDCDGNVWEPGVAQWTEVTA